MYRRITKLSLPAAALVLLLSWPAVARAHRLDAQAFILPGNKVQVEAWFSNGDPVMEGKVEVFRLDGSLFCTGQSDANGIFVFALPQREPLRIVVSAGAGHRKELMLAADGNTALADHTPAFPLKDVIIGTGFLLALAAFWLGIRNARMLRKLSQSR